MCIMSVKVGEVVQQQSYNVQKSVLGKQFAKRSTPNWLEHPRLCHARLGKRRYGHDPVELRWPKQLAVANHILRMASTTLKAPKANLAI